MFILFGLNTRNTWLGEVVQMCPICKRETCHTREERATRLTVYFIPLAPLGKKEAVRCNLCGHETAM